MTSFVDRETELDTLQSRYAADEPSLITVWGRRRVGKTELVERSVRDREDAVLYQATQTTSQVQLDDFVDEAAATFPGVERIRREWEALLGYLLERDAVVVLDEFPFLIEADESLPSVVQRLWDHELDDTGGTLVLIGSSISMMTEKVMSGGSPLHGRFDTRLRLGELPFDAVSQLLPAYDPDEQVFAWAIFGGTPHYLQAVDDGRSLAANVREAVLSKRGFLHDEPEYVLRTELAEPNRYSSDKEKAHPFTGGMNPTTWERISVSANGSFIHLESVYTTRLRRFSRPTKRIISDSAQATFERTPFEPLAVGSGQKVTLTPSMG